MDGKKRVISEEHWVLTEMIITDGHSNVDLEFGLSALSFFRSSKRMPRQSLTQLTQTDNQNTPRQFLLEYRINLVVHRW